MIGLVEVALVTTIVAVLYGRSGVFKSRQFQAIWPYISPQRRPVGRPGSQPGANVHAAQAAAPAKKKRIRRLPTFDGNKLYWFLTILAATAVSTWIIISRGWGPGLTH